MANLTGITATEAINSLTTGLGRQSQLILDNLGVTFQAADAYEWYAQKLGVTADKLTEAQKKEAWQAYAIEQITKKAEILGDAMSQAQLQQEQWNASLENFKTSIGGLLAPLSGVQAALSGWMPLIGTLAGQLIPDLIKKTSLMSKVTKIFGTSMHLSLGPIAAVTIALTALAWAYETNFLGFRDLINNVAAVVTEKLEWVAEQFQNLTAIFDGFGKAVQGVFNWLQNIRLPEIRLPQFKTPTVGTLRFGQASIAAPYLPPGNVQESTTNKVDVYSPIYIDNVSSELDLYKITDAVDRGVGEALRRRMP